MPQTAHRSGGFLTPVSPVRGCETAAVSGTSRIHDCCWRSRRGLGNPRSDDVKDVKVVRDFSRRGVASSGSVMTHGRGGFAERALHQCAAVWPTEVGDYVRNSPTTCPKVGEPPVNSHTTSARSGRPPVKTHTTSSRSGRPPVRLHTTSSRSGRPPVRVHTTSSRSGRPPVKVYTTSSRSGRPPVRVHTTSSRSGGAILRMFIHLTDLGMVNFSHKTPVFS